MTNKIEQYRIVETLTESQISDLMELYKIDTPTPKGDGILLVLSQNIQIKQT